MQRQLNKKQLALLMSRELRKKQTESEIMFWSMVRNKKYKGLKFLRQHPVFYEYYGEEKFFIADFYCRELNLIVEIDGGIHEQQKDYDQIRTELLEIQKGLRVVRFSNKDIKYRKKYILKKLPPPCAQGGGWGEGNYYCNLSLFLIPFYITDFPSL